MIYKPHTTIWFGVQTCVSWETGTRVAVDAICTGARVLTRHRDTLIDVDLAFRAGVPRLAGARPAVHVIVTRAVVTRAGRALVDVHLTMGS